MVTFSAVEPRPLTPGTTPTAESKFSGIVGVVRSGGEFRLIALRTVAPGERMFQIEGEKTHRPSRYSVQIGENLHIDLNLSHSTEEVLDRYFWRFMNHGCEPNTAIRGRDVVALRTIQRWDDVTFNYNSTEHDMAEPFACRCGSPRCHGTVRGFKYLTRQDQERLRPSLAAHLLRHLDPLSPGVAMPVTA